jgi:peptide deformylase
VAIPARIMSVNSIIQLKEKDFYRKDTILRRKSEIVSNFDDDLQQTITNLIDTLNAHSIAVGLSAPQIGILTRVTVINTKKREKNPKPPLVLINPYVLNSSENTDKKLEACMSVPFFQGEVERPMKVTIKYQTATGAKSQLHAEGFLARVLLHEIDHLDGILYVDRMTSESKLIPAEFFKEDKINSQ